MKVTTRTVIEHQITRRGVQVAYNNKNPGDEETIWISCNGLYGWHTPKSAMNLVKAIIKLKSDLKKAGIKI